MTEYKLVPFEPTPEMVSAAEDAYMPFGDMDLALRMAILAAPAAPVVQTEQEPVAFANFKEMELCMHKPAAGAWVPVYAAPPAHPDAALVEALESLMESESRGRVMPVGESWDQARAALAAYRKQGGEV